MKTVPALLVAGLALALACVCARAEDFSGTVVETMDSAGYTYMLIKTPKGNRWAAVNQTKVKKGDKVSIVNSMDMQNFESPTLHKKFEHIAFGMRGDGATPSPAANPHGSAPVYKGGPIKVAKAEGPDARTIAEVYAHKKELAGKEVVVSGEVVKYNANILNNNWLHIQDGSGSAKGKDNDLTVVTKDDSALLKTITVRGKVVLDKDLGGMYQFPVSLEDAKIVK